MAPISQTAIPVELSPHSDGHAHGAIHVPQPGVTARLISDLRELFKVRVTGMVVVTGWAGFYLGSMQSGISSVQRGLLDTLLGIGLVSAGSGALNQCLERRIDALMKRTADRPLASGRYPLWFGVMAGLGAIALGAWWLLLHTNLLTVALALLTAFTYVAIYTPLKRVTTMATFIGAFPGAMGPLLGWVAARGPHGVAGGGAVRNSVRVAVSAFHGDCMDVSRRVRQGRHPHAAGGAAGRMVHGD